MLLERLEGRRLFSVSFDVPAKIVTIDGTSGDDEILAKVQNGVLKISDNGASFNVTASAVEKLFIFCGDGADVVTLQPSVTQRAVVYSGAGAGALGDTIQTGSGPDTIYLQSSGSTARGGAGADYLYNLLGLNYLYGEGGDDHLINSTTDTTESVYNGGANYDVLDMSALTASVVLRNGVSGEYIPGTGSAATATAPTVVGYSTDSVSGMEAFYSGSGHDWVFGTDGSNLIRTGAGNDKAFGGGGNDFLFGGPGLDALYGQGGNDQLYDRDGAKDFLDGGAGTDGAQSDALDILVSIEYPIA